MCTGKFHRFCLQLKAHINPFKYLQSKCPETLYREKIKTSLIKTSLCHLFWWCFLKFVFLRPQEYIIKMHVLLHNQKISHISGNRIYLYMEFTFSIKSNILCISLLPQGSCFFAFSLTFSLTLSLTFSLTFSLFLSHQLLSLFSFFFFFSFLSALLSMCTYESQLCPLQRHFILTKLFLIYWEYAGQLIFFFVLQAGDRTYQLIWAQYQRTRRQMKK